MSTTNNEMATIAKAKKMAADAKRIEREAKTKMMRRRGELLTKKFPQLNELTTVEEETDFVAHLVYREDDMRESSSREDESSSEAANTGAGVYTAPAYGSMHD